jgi:4-carboxymuconolactone decarboxylase
MNASSDDRFPPLPEALWSDAQRRHAAPLIAGPRGGVIGPFVPLLRSPELMDCAQRMGAYLRYRSAIGTRLSELAILITARQWTQQVEWAIHAPIAEQAGIAKPVIDAIAAGVRPEAMSDEEAAVHDFSVELHRNRRVSDAVFARARDLFAEQGVVDLMGILGYYTFLSMVMNGAQTAAPASEAAPLRELHPRS